MAAEVRKYEPDDEPVGPAGERGRIPFWRRRHGSRAPIASRLARKISGLAFELKLDDATLHRGGAVTGTVAITKRRGRAKNVELGLVCVESYDVQRTTYVNNRSQQTRVTERATAHEQWLRLEETAAEHAFSFTVPEGAPFSYDGKALSFAWQVRAVSRASVRPDAAAHWEVAILP